MEYILILFIDIRRIKAVESDLYILASGKKVFKSVRQPKSYSFEWFELVWDFPLGKHPSSDDDYIYGISDNDGFLYKVKQRSKLAKRNKKLNISKRKFTDVQVSNNKLFVLEGEKLLKSPMDPIRWEAAFPDSNIECGWRVRIDSEDIFHCIYKSKVVATHKKVMPTDEKKIALIEINNGDRVFGVSPDERDNVYIASWDNWNMFYDGEEQIWDITILDWKLLGLKEISSGNGRVIEIIERNS